MLMFGSLFSGQSDNTGRAAQSQEHRKIQRIDLLAYALIFFLCLSSLAVALTFGPVEGDDLRFLSSVVNTNNPLTYLFSDSLGSGSCLLIRGCGGLSTSLYRPLHSIMIWISYKLFGINPAFDQFINLLIHACVVCLLYRLIRLSGSGAAASFLISALAIASPYTLSPATWISDRSTLIVAFSLMAFLNYIYTEPHGLKRKWIVLLLCSVALLGKESGLILPLFIIFSQFIYKLPCGVKLRNILLGSAIIILYLLFRMVIFGPKAASYEESGYILGIFHYSDSSLLPHLLKAWMYVDNFLKNIFSLALPVFDWEGGINASQVLIKTMPFWLATFLLVVLSTSTQFLPFQKEAMLLVVLNSLIHIAIFRYRIQYISMLSLCLYVGSSVHWRSRSVRKYLCIALAVLLMATNFVAARQQLNDTAAYRQGQMNRDGISLLAKRYDPQIKKNLIDLLITKYKL